MHDALQFIVCPLYIYIMTDTIGHIRFMHEKYTFHRLNVTLLYDYMFLHYFSIDSLCIYTEKQISSYDLFFILAIDIIDCLVHHTIS